MLIPLTPALSQNAPTNLLYVRGWERGQDRSIQHYDNATAKPEPPLRQSNRFSHQQLNGDGDFEHAGVDFFHT